LDGKELLYGLRQLLNESSTSTFLDIKSSYYWINEAAKEIVNRTHCLSATQTITTIAQQTAYPLNANFLKLYLMDTNDEFFIKYNDGVSDSFIKWDKYQNIVYQNQTDSTPIPYRFSIIDAILSDKITGVTSATGTLSGGECILTASASDFSNVNAGDIVHNTTDSSDGIVLEKTSSTILKTALFNGTNQWGLADSFVIVPQGRLQLILDPPPSTSGHTITVYYQQRPDPVYSDYRTFRFLSQYNAPLIKYAMFLYKYKDRSPNFGDNLYILANNEIKRAATNINLNLNRQGFRVNFKKRRR